MGRHWQCNGITFCHISKREGTPSLSFTLPWNRQLRRKRSIRRFGIIRKKDAAGIPMTSLLSVWWLKTTSVQQYFRHLPVSRRCFLHPLRDPIHRPAPCRVWCDSPAFGGTWRPRYPAPHAKNAAHFAVTTKAPAADINKKALLLMRLKITHLSPGAISL